MEKAQRPSIFKRLIALLVDTLVLGSLGYVLGLMFEDYFVSLGKFGVLIGGIITVVYFGILQSKINKGQSVGKFFLNFKVTNTDGNFLSIQKSLVRSFILIFPIVTFSAFTGDNFLFIIGLVLSILNLLNLYFVLMNSSRRSLADILTGSVVTYNDSKEFAIDLPNDYKKNNILILTILIVSYSIYFVFSKGPDNDFLTTSNEIEKLVWVSNVAALKHQTISTFSTNKDYKASNYIEVVVQVKNKVYLDNNSQEMIDEIAKMIKTSIPEAGNVDFISITLSYDFDIGIAKKYHNVVVKI